MKKFSIKIFLNALTFGFLISGVTFAKTLTVINNKDAGIGSLRQAIIDANADPLTIDSIVFALPSAPFTIALSTPLDPILGPALIDGTKQNASGNPLINVTLSGAGAIFNFKKGSDGSSLTGIVISGGTQAILIEGSNGIAISNNYIGTDGTGTAKGVPTGTDVEINDSKSTIISGNIISGAVGPGINFSSGVLATVCTGTIIKSNYIGTDRSGTINLGNGGEGIVVQPGVNFSDSKIGGKADSLNIISGNLKDGISISGNSATISSNVWISGNYIGIDKSGNVALPNQLDGIKVNYVSTLVVLKNIISGNVSNGVEIDNSPSSIVQANFVGLNAAGLLPIGNGKSGISIAHSNNVLVGGSFATKNVVSGNQLYGIEIKDNSNNCVVKGNYAGLDSKGSGAVSLGNRRAGIYLSAVSDGIIGGFGAGEGNVSSQNGIVNGDDDTDGIRIKNGIRIQILNNFCGTDATGMIKKGNRWAGISVNNSVNTYVYRNVASGNKNEGIFIQYEGSNPPASNNLVTYNYVGVAADSTTALANDDYGINLGKETVLNDFIVKNTIAYTGMDGVSGPSYGWDGSAILVKTSAKYILISQNKIFCNLKGISLDGSANLSIKPPTIDFSDKFTANGTAGANNVVEIFSNPGSCNCQGKIYVGKATAGVDGTWTYTFAAGDNVANITATQTSPEGSTSAFSPCCVDAKITSQPVAEKYFCADGSVTIQAKSTLGTRFQWQELKPGDLNYISLKEGGIYRNVTSTNLTLLNIPQSMVGYRYRLLVYACVNDVSNPTVLKLSVPAISISGNEAFCSGKSTTLTATGGKSYLWSPTVGLNTTTGAAVIAGPMESTTYTVNAKDSIGCPGSATKALTVNKSPVMIKPSDITISNGSSITVPLQSTFVAATTFNWSPAVLSGTPSGASEGSGLAINQTLYNAETDTAKYTYTVNGTYQGCPSNPVTFKVNIVGGIRIPDVFTANGDGKNDVFTFTGTTIYKIKIYNRWGHVVYEGNEKTNRWDGKTPHGDRCAEGTYFYILNAIDLNNKYYNGYITLIH